MIKKLVRDILGNEYHTIGNNWPVFSKVLDYVGKTSDAFTIAELIPVTSNLVAGSSTLSVIGTTAGALSTSQGQWVPIKYCITCATASWSGNRVLWVNLEKSGMKPSISVNQMLEKTLVEKHIQKKQLQFILQALGDGKPKQLCLLLLRGFEDKVDGYASKLAWKSNYSITYPQ